MNMFQLQERIKDFSKDQLVKEMQQPSGAVPPFLVLSELQRRTRMEKAFQAEQAQGQQSTVAQDAIAAAGVPQGGIADMARAMAPQTDMTGNTGAMPVQNMQEGGAIAMRPPRIEDQAEPMSQRERSATRRGRLGQDLFEEALAVMESSPAGAGRNAISRILQQVSPEGYAAASNASGRELDEEGGLGVLAILPALFARRRGVDLTKYPSLNTSRMSDGGVIRMQPGGEVEGPNTAALRAIMEAQNTIRGMQARNRAMQAMLNRTAPDEPSLADVGPRVIPVMDEFAGLPAEMTEPGTLAAVEPTLGTSRAGAAPAVDLAPPTLTNTDILRETLRRDGRPMATLGATLDPRFYPMPPDALPPVQGPNRPPRPLETDGPSMLSDDELAAIAGLSPGVMAPVQGPNLPLPPVDPSEFGGLPDFMTEQGGTVPEPQPGQGIMPSDIGRAIGEAVGFGPAMDVARAARRTPEALPMDTGTPLTAPEETDGGIEALLAPAAPAAAVADRSGGTGGGARAAGAGAADADKWLALAQFGLGLMASQAPTLGGAIGEAGTAALGQLRESQKEAYERDLAERTLAARSAGGSRGPSFGNLISLANARITAAQAELERLNMDGITDLEKAVAEGRGDEFRSATADLLDANNLLRSLGPALTGGASLSDVDIDLTQ